VTVKLRRNRLEGMKLPRVASPQSAAGNAMFTPKSGNFLANLISPECSLPRVVAVKKQEIATNISILIGPAAGKNEANFEKCKHIKQLK
jgi:hypothetical protein